MFPHLTPDEAILRRLELTAAAIHRAVHTSVGDLDVVGWVTAEPVPYSERDAGRRVKPRPGDEWGQLWDCAWFHVTGTVPQSAQGQRLVVLLDLGGEACVVNEDGEPVLGLTPADSGFDADFGSAGKRVITIADGAVTGELIDLWVEAGCNNLFGSLPSAGRLGIAALALERLDTQALFYDFSTLLDLARTLPERSARRAQIVAGLKRASARMRSFDQTEVDAARNLLRPALEKQGSTATLSLSATGQAHLDLAWLWPIRETIRKGGRTFSTALAMMDRYPDYIFGASQPQLYQWMKDRYPGLYSRVEERIREGRWEPQGGMWVESDVNVPSGESIVRQLLYGARFYKDEFGLEPQVAWLPDNFGFPASLPQILKKSGIDYFLTIKLSWNSVTVFPRHSFWWRGIDGSAVLAHMPPEGTYNSAALSSSLRKIEESYLDKDVSQYASLLYGIGDGGGGPGVEHLERLDRMRMLEGLPPVRQETSLDFFKRLETESGSFREWDGELYLEYHQGTFTTQGRTKRNNRKLELALRDAEFISVLAARHGHPYPADDLNRVWKEALLYQFHDILPGSSISRVYEESAARYGALFTEVEALIESAAGTLVGSGPDSDGGHATSGAPLLAVNSLPWTRSEWVKRGESWQYIEAIPPMSCVVLDARQSLVAHEISAGSRRLENEHLIAEFNANGTVSSLLEKASGRESLAAPANVLTAYADDGNAWDFPPNYRDGWSQWPHLLSSEPLLDGPRAILRQRYELGRSTIFQDVVLAAGSRRLEFQTRIDWRETHIMLRAGFPIAVQARDVVAEIQFGNVHRPVHRNTAWHEARDEFCAHRWVDLAQHDYGVALLNDCKYGHSVNGNVIDLNLLRSPTYPDPTADQGLQEFAYALYPHRGDHVTGNVPREAYELNVPLRIIPFNGRTSPSPFSLFSVEGDGLMLDTVKRAEDTDDTIVRLYEWAGGSASATLRCSLPIREAWLTDLMENPIRRLEPSEAGLVLHPMPFEILTLKLSFG